MVCGLLYLKGACHMLHDMIIIFALGSYFHFCLCSYFSKCWSHLGIFDTLLSSILRIAGFAIDVALTIAPLQR